MNPDDDKKIFEEFRKFYKGAKRGLDTEFNAFVKKNRDYKELLPLLKPAYENEEKYREEKAGRKEFFQNRSHLKKWLNQRYWENEYEVIENNNKKTEDFNQLDKETFLNRLKNDFEKIHLGDAEANFPGDRNKQYQFHLDNPKRFPKKSMQVQ